MIAIWLVSSQMLPVMGRICAITVMLKIFPGDSSKNSSATFSSPGDMLGWINETLIGQGIEKHVAMFLGIIDKQSSTLHYSMAAHYPPALLSSPSGETQLCGSS